MGKSTFSIERFSKEILSLRMNKKSKKNGYHIEWRGFARDRVGAWRDGQLVRGAWRVYLGSSE